MGGLLLTRLRVSLSRDESYGDKWWGDATPVRMCLGPRSCTLASSTFRSVYFTIKNVAFILLLPQQNLNQGFFSVQGAWARGQCDPSRRSPPCRLPHYRHWPPRGGADESMLGSIPQAHGGKLAIGWGWTEGGEWISIHPRPLCARQSAQQVPGIQMTRSALQEFTVHPYLPAAFPAAEPASVARGGDVVCGCPPEPRAWRPSRAPRGPGS